MEAACAPANRHKKEHEELVTTTHGQSNAAGQIDR
jgi:hypothetical protein